MPITIIVAAVFAAVGISIAIYTGHIKEAETFTEDVIEQVVEDELAKAAQPATIKPSP